MLNVRQLETVQDSPRDAIGFKSDTVHFTKLHQLMRSRNTKGYKKQKENTAWYASYKGREQLKDQEKYENMDKIDIEDSRMFSYRNKLMLVANT